MIKYLRMWKNIRDLKNKRNIKDVYIGEIDKSEYCIIDVRGHKEYLEWHINGAINIPLSDIRRKIISVNKQEKILLYCQSGIRSVRAARILERLGYEKIYNLKGGLENNISEALKLMEMSIEDTLKTVQNSRKELK